MTTHPGEPGPLAGIFEVAEPVATSIALRVLADHDSGLVRLALAVLPSVQVVLGPEVALEIATRLVGTVAELRHDRRRRP